MSKIKVIDRGLPIGIYYDEKPVCTTEQLATAYGADVKMLSKNFNNNKERYVEGKHYILLKGEELKKLKTTIRKNYDLSSDNCNQNLRIVGERAPQLYLWTERGAMLHAKSLNTDKAWEVYERLVDFYFQAKEDTVPPAKLPKRKSSKKELPSINRHSEAVIKAIGVLLSQGYTTQPYIHNTVPKEPFLGFDEDTHVYIPSKLVYDTYKQITVNCLDLTNLCRVLAEDRIINNDEKRWIRNYNGDAGYTYVRNAAGHKYRMLRFCKESIYPRLLKDINAGNIPELYQ